jgi:nucleoside-triphosphatase THEP1
MPDLIILYGAPMTGKTSYLTRVIARWQENGYAVSGVLSPAIFAAGEKTAIQVRDLRSGETRFLAKRRSTRDLTAPAPGYVFDEENLQWADRALANAVPTQILVLDELGPLEIRHKQGWQSGIRAVLSYQYDLAVVVLRETLHADVRDAWQVRQWIEYNRDLPVDLFDAFLRKVDVE